MVWFKKYIYITKTFGYWGSSFWPMAICVLLISKRHQLWKNKKVLTLDRPGKLYTWAAMERKKSWLGLLFFTRGQQFLGKVSGCVTLVFWNLNCSTQGHTETLALTKLSQCMDSPKFSPKNPWQVVLGPSGNLVINRNSSVSIWSLDLPDIKK